MMEGGDGRKGLLMMEGGEGREGKGGRGREGGEGRKGHERQDMHGYVADTTVYRRYPCVDWRRRLFTKLLLMKK